MTIVALDLDGTIEDSRQDMVSSVHRVRRLLGLPNGEDTDFVGHVNRGMPHLYAHCFSELWQGEKPSGELLARVRDEYSTDYAAHIADTTCPYPGMKEALESLSDLAHLAVVTNKPEHLSIALLEALGLAEHFKAIIGGDTCDESKPSAVPLAEAVARCGGGKAIMVGDSAGDIRCAKAYGCPVIWCAWGYSAQPGPSTPHAIAKFPSELPSIIGQLLNSSTIE